MALLALLAALAADAAPALPEPLTPAAVGKAQCFSPDLAHKACRSIHTYALRPDGQIADTATVVIGKKPMVLITTVAVATVTNRRVCTTMKKEDLTAATFTIDGGAPTDEQATELHGVILNNWNALVGHAVCVSFEADGSEFVAHTAFDGLPRPTLDQRMMWVAPQDGWKVTP
jgi:hypothetical protein